MPHPLHLQSHPLWAIKRRVGFVTLPVVFAGRELTLHGPTQAHVIRNAAKLVFPIGLYATQVQP